MKVTIICLTYNHQAFIRDALNSFVEQKTNFDYEVIIHDDASTDKTAKIIKRYENEYPHIIKPIYQTENQWRQGKTLSKTFIYPKVKGEYVIFCEGDDYFSDPNKLQKQVDFLDANPDFSICFHPVKIVWDKDAKPSEIFPPTAFSAGRNTFQLEELIRQNFIQTNSCMYRWRFHKEDVNTLMPDNIIPGDYFMHLLHAQVGKISFLPEIMAVYRRHSDGIWTDLHSNPIWYLRYGLKHINFYVEVEKLFNVNKEEDMQQMADGLLLSAIAKNSSSVLQLFMNTYPELYAKTKIRLQKAYEEKNEEVN